MANRSSFRSRLCLVPLAVLFASALPARAQTLGPTSFSFGSWPAKTTSTSEIFTLSNIQTVPLSISSISASGDFGETSNCAIAPNTLPAGATCKIAVTFTPTVIGARTGMLTVTDGASNSPQTAQLSGTGVAPVSLSSASLVFASQVENTTSSPTSITLYNFQTVPLTISGISASGNFSTTSTCPLSPATLGARSTCTISVTFTPTTLGTLTGTLTITDSASNSPQTAQLSGTGTAPVGLSSASLAFASQFENTTSSPVSITLYNYQTVPLTISGISASGNFSTTTTCPLSPATLGARSSCTISVSFTPTAVGAQTGTLTITNGASNSPQTVQLSGTGTAPVSLSSASLTFANQFENTTSSPASITLYNYQTVPLTISGISASGNFSTTSTCPLSPATLGARSSCAISVTFTPTTLGTQTGTLTIADGASNSPQTAQLSGTGTAPVSLSSASLTFASQVIGTTSGGKSETLKNSQSVPLTISSISVSGNFSQASNCPLSPNKLAAGASCTISVTFTPSALGTLTGTLTITDSASTSPQAVSLSGAGTLAGLLSISVTPSQSTLTEGNQRQFVATGAWTGGVQENITNFVTWSSSAPSVAPANSTGLVQAITQGGTTITASYGSVSGSTTVTVAPPTLTSIAVIPGSPSAPVGAHEQFTAVLNYSDGSTKDETSVVIWSSSASVIASINSSGLSTTLSPGSTTITASLESITGSTTLTVSQPQCISPAPGLIGWWTADGNVVDIAGNDSGTLQNNATYGNGEVGQAFSFAGNGDSVLVNSPVYSPTAGTLMFWFLPTGAGWLTGSYDGTNRTPGLSVDSNGNLDWEFGNLSAQEVGQVNFNQWSQVALTYSASNSDVIINVYLNGNLAASAITSPLSSWYSQVALGAYLGAQKPSFVGAMDEVAIFNQALSAQQIQQSYNAFSAGMCKPALQSIAVTPPNPAMAVGLSQQFDATGSYSDGSTHDLTTSATWSSSNPAVATVSGSGQAMAVAIGNAPIAAALGANTGSTNLNVVPSLMSLQVNPPNPSIPAGNTQAFTATGTFSDGSMQDVTTSVSWSSSLLAVATITGGGLASGIDAGQATITATAGSVSASTLLTVNPATTAVLNSIAVNPANPSLLAGSPLQFTATGTYSDNSTQDLTNAAAWTSSNTSVASINSTGLASGLTTGATMIGATFQSVNGSTTLTLTLSSPLLQSITVTPANVSLAIGQNQRLAATGLYSDGSTQTLTSSVSWSSSQPAVAGITSAGLASGLSGGSTTITATLGTVAGQATLGVNSIALLSITVSPGNASIAPGTNRQLAATGTYADGGTLDLTASVTWSSSVPTVATVNTTGLATGATTGQTMINASAANMSGSSTLNVTSAALASIAVTPAMQTIPIGITEQFAATGAFTDGSVQNITGSAQWISSNDSIATVSNAGGTQGLATSVATGSSSISATSGSISASTNLTVNPVSLVSITVNPSNPSIALGTTQPFTATGTFSDGSTSDLTASATWGSGNAAVASVNSSALATSLAPGTATVTSTVGDISGATQLTVTPAAVVSITVNPAFGSIPLGLNQSFTALGTFSDGSTQDVSSSAHWSSSVPAVATVSNTPGSQGIAASTGSGGTLISATLSNVAGSGGLTVSTVTLAAITISPQGPSIPIGGSKQFTATGLYSDGSTANITSAAAWASSSVTVATISNGSGAQGLATSAGSGTTGISATWGSVTVSTALTVQDQLLSISVAPAGGLITPGADQQFTATGTYLSGLSQDLTNTVLWTSSNPAVATITTGGLAVTAAPGQSVITANMGSISGVAALTVTPIQHVVIIFQENRTPDNLFQDPVLISNGADIQNSGVNSSGHTIPLSQIDLGTVGANPDYYDLSHAHSAFVSMCDFKPSTGLCAMDGANLIPITCLSGVTGCPPPNPQFRYVNPSDVAPYFQMAEQYTFADHMFQSNQGPSFPAHQFILSGTSAPAVGSNLFAAENPYGVTNPNNNAGCTAPAAEFVALINSAGIESSTTYPCFEHPTITDLLEAANLTWNYYSPGSGSIWTAPNAIQHMCGPNATPPNATECIGSDWINHVVLNQTRVLSDISSGQLPTVSWVIPSGLASDHSNLSNGSGPSWVSSIVNAIGNSPYWANTAIFITWDDWGGWYDHVPPATINNGSSWGSGYVYGFRVPMIVVSPYAKPAYISHVTHDFGSILKFIEQTFSLPSLGYADLPADNLSDCFNFTQTPIPFRTIAAPLNADYFLNDSHPPTDPDDD